MRRFSISSWCDVRCPDTFGFEFVVKRRRLMVLLKKVGLAIATLVTAFATLMPASIALAQEDPGDAAGAAAGLGFGLFGLFCMALYFIVVLAGLVFWIMMIVDVAKREESQFPNSTGNSKTIWLIVVILLGVIGAIVYYFAVKRKAPLPK